MYTKILIYLFRRSFNGKGRKKLTPTINDLFKTIATDALKLQSSVIHVKKGKRRYKIVSFVLPTFNFMVKVSRHWNDKTTALEVNL